ncbi:hypothetical protein LCGC14_2156760 [marine sediment metagenome]|uniref:Uncharacterized protein n=1 Tax=marine sediment metagenome TaxID=412755 RepID=A0A0F9DTX9_9ZZZZ
MKEKVEEWFKLHETHIGKWSLIGRIAKDLNLETFKYGLAFWDKKYDWNNQVAEALNKLLSQEKLKVTGHGRAYKYEYVEDK